MPRWRDVVIAGKGGLLAVLGRIWPGRRAPMATASGEGNLCGQSQPRRRVRRYITVARFLGDAEGDVAPTSELYVNHALAVARDRRGNIYVASDTGNQVRVYAPATVGTAPAPLRTIQGPNTKLHGPSGLAVDSQGNLYVAERGGPANASAVLKFAPKADGDVAPIAVIPSRMPPPGETAAVNTGLDIASGVALDYDNSIYVVTVPNCSARARANSCGSTLVPMARGARRRDHDGPQRTSAGGPDHGRKHLRQKVWRIPRSRFMPPNRQQT